ncbi:MAG: PDZ domain-containing protein, partial [Dysgonamonadaceae bacterium]|nr:PDZ domain-containing protein [Dysgonamonadaceae bacterium]
MKKLFLILFCAIIGFQGYAQNPEQKNDDRYFTINKNIDILTTILKEIDLFYVDSLEVDKVVNQTIHSMLMQLDPYTNYITEEDMSDLQFMTTGEYAGIGSIISYKDSNVVINEPYEGLPADKSGLKAGDVILQIDNHDV